ncbi:MAG: type IV pilin N-terminal domain-containing protein [Methanoregula sp.]|nr:type IV pilin N-terminal domain-containing protein [Methanoregula sp.]
MTRRYHTSREDHAVSPVVGVMLMLVVTIIIAAVVTGFSGGLIGKVDEKAPTLTVDVKIINMGSWTGSGFFATVTSVSGPISTRDIKIVTSWTASRSSANAFQSISGGNTTRPGMTNVNALGDPTIPVSLVAPFGTGPGINGSATIGSLDTDAATFSSLWQQFGNYSLMSGTTLTAQPCGAADLETIGGSSADQGYGVRTMYQYAPEGATYLDPASAVLGPHWESLKAGDRVNVKVIYTPTGSVIFQKDIPVTEG